MNVFGRFMKQDGQGRMSATRVVPKQTTVQDLDDFKLLPTESLELWEKNEKKYVSLKCRIHRSHYQTLDRLNAITAYLKALYTKV